jgi:predicted nucleotidyltransferase
MFMADATIHHGIPFDRARLAVFCQTHGIRRLSLFGSVLRDDFGPDSDVDVLIEFPEGQTPSLLQLGGMQVELTEILGREVDLKTPQFLSRYFRNDVLRSAEVQYAA